MNLVCEHRLDLKGSRQQVVARVYAPELPEAESSWRCRIEIDEPFNIERFVYGETSLQSLVLAISTMSAYLYGSESYKSGRLGSFGQFGGYLGIPAPGAFLDVAPFPF
jgi:hypothetical protein